MLATDGPFCPFIHAADDRPRQHPWSFPQRRLAHYLLVTSLHGEEQIVVAGQPYQVAKGCTYLVPPNALADLGSLHGNTPVWVHFDLVYDARRTQHPHAQAYESELGERAALLQPGSKEIWGVDLPVLLPHHLTPLFREGVPNLVKCWKQRHHIAVLEATHLLTGLLLTWVSSTWEKQTVGPVLSVEARINRAEALALRHLDTAFDVDDFAAAAGYSRSRFCAVYHRLRSISPGVFLRRERMRVAESLLSRADLPIAKVGTMVGYPDSTVFGRVFRASHGVSPGQWRKQLAL